MLSMIYMILFVPGTLLSAYIMYGGPPRDWFQCPNRRCGDLPLGGGEPVPSQLGGCIHEEGLPDGTEALPDKHHGVAPVATHGVRVQQAAQVVEQGAHKREHCARGDTTVQTPLLPARRDAHTQAYTAHALHTHKPRAVVR